MLVRASGQKRTWCAVKVEWTPTPHQGVREQHDVVLPIRQPVQKARLNPHRSSGQARRTKRGIHPAETLESPLDAEPSPRRKGSKGPQGNGSGPPIVFGSRLKAGGSVLAGLNGRDLTYKIGMNASSVYCNDVSLRKAKRPQWNQRLWSQVSRGSHAACGVRQVESSPTP